RSRRSAQVIGTIAVVIEQGSRHQCGHRIDIHAQRIFLSDRWILDHESYRSSRCTRYVANLIIEGVYSWCKRLTGQRPASVRIDRQVSSGQCDRTTCGLVSHRTTEITSAKGG